MKYMLIMRATDEAVEAYKETPFEQVIEAMGKYNESMIKAGVLAAGEGGGLGALGVALVVERGVDERAAVRQPDGLGELRLDADVGHLGAALDAEHESVVRRELDERARDPQRQREQVLQRDQRQEHPQHLRSQRLAEGVFDDG